VTSEPRAFASLSSGLLARKGAARPAMRPQGFGQMGSGLEDLGWNDMGFEPPKPALAPVRDSNHDGFGDEVPQPPLRNPVAGLTPVSPVHHQQAELAERLSGCEERGGDAGDPDDAGPMDLEASTVLDLVPSAEGSADPTTEAPAEVQAEAQAEAPEPQIEAQPEPRAEAAPAIKPAPRRMPRPRSAPGAKAKAAFTLRLDPDRHLKLRLACAVTANSAQQIVTKALDELLAAMPELDAMAKRASDRGNQKG